MSLAGRKRRRQSEIGHRHKRRTKVAKLKKKIAKAQTDGERQALILKLHKVAPGASLPK